MLTTFFRTIHYQLQHLQWKVKSYSMITTANTGWWFQPRWKYHFPIYGKHVPNHQPEYLCILCCSLLPSRSFRSSRDQRKARKVNGASQQAQQAGSMTRNMSSSPGSSAGAMDGSEYHRGVSIVMEVSQSGWFISWKVPLKWMRTGGTGTPISGNPMKSYEIHINKHDTTNEHLYLPIVQWRLPWGREPLLPWRRKPGRLSGT